MFNELLLSATLNMSLVQVPYVQQYQTLSVYDSVINTFELSKKNVMGAYPWEIVKPYGDNLYFLYENYFRMGSTSGSKSYHYFQGLSLRRQGIVRRLINPVDYIWVRYFDIDNILATITYKIDNTRQMKPSCLSKLLYHRQIALDLQKESLDFQQNVLDTVQLSQYVQNLCTLNFD